MQNFIVYYKDYLGRSNEAAVGGKTQLEAENKFKTLYANCTITNVVCK
jgi:hypothetical protein